VIFRSKASCQLNAIKLREKERAAEKIYKIANELIGTSINKTSGASVQKNHVSAKIPAGTKIVPAILRITYASNSIIRLNIIEINFSSVPYICHLFGIEIFIRDKLEGFYKKTSESQ
jgi:hypothetical protein